SAYIPTNVISITDGQIFLENSLFYQGIRPAVNVGISVSRVGSAAQIKAMKQVSGTMKLDLAQYREMASFAQFSSDLDTATKKMLNRGAHLTELLKQPVYHPMPVEDEVISIFAGVNGYLDNIALKDVKTFEAKAIEQLKLQNPELISALRQQKTLTDDIVAALKAFFDAFSANFNAKDKAA
ncbi:MAG: F0F1 ATP synthase subunit alpha, partial [Alphaproteobacteria bacterium]|nr:F0F1 ATP synthase subunit alpha [Alphaproteobacteria bacterium]